VQRRPDTGGEVFAGMQRSTIGMRKVESATLYLIAVSSCRFLFKQCVNLRSPIVPSRNFTSKFSTISRRPAFDSRCAFESDKPAASFVFQTPCSASCWYITVSGITTASAGLRFPVRCSDRLAIVYRKYHSMAPSRLYYTLYPKKGQISLAKLTYDRCGEEDPVLG
jgi:hypothetical protein